MRIMQRFLQRFICVGLVASAGMATLEGQSPVIWGPILGFTPSAGGAAIPPILGVPGASTLADPLIIDGTFRGVIVSPKQNYAVAVRVDDRKAVVIDLASSQVMAMSEANPDSFLLGISPRGSAVAVYDGGTG